MNKKIIILIMTCFLILTTFTATVITGKGITQLDVEGLEIPQNDNDVYVYLLGDKTGWEGSKVTHVPPSGDERTVNFEDYEETRSCYKVHFVVGGMSIHVFKAELAEDKIDKYHFINDKNEQEVEITIGYGAVIYIFYNFEKQRFLA
jgi:hypothetical protein